MSTLLLHSDASASVERALARGRLALSLTKRGQSAALYAAMLEGDARVIGAWQRVEDAVKSDRPIHARETGGPAVIAGEGIAYVALAMKDASVFMECPRDRVLNRNVRGLLAALRQLGASAHYFGRELVSVDRRPAGLLGWTRAREGAVLLEVFLGASRSFVVSDRELPLVPSERMMGKAPITLREALAATPDASALAAACASAYAAMGGLEIVPHAIEGAVAAEPRSFPASMRWSTPREIPIGFVRAGLAVDERGIVTGAAVTGDFYQDASAPDLLDAALRGGLATHERLRDALNAAYGPHGAVIEGLRSLQPILDAFVELAG